MTFVRRLAAAAGLGVHRLRHGGVRAALVALGLAGATVLLVGVLVGSTSTERATLAHAVDRLPPAERTVRIAWFGVESQGPGYAELDRVARGRLAALAAGRPAATVLFRESSIGGAYVSLGAVDGLAQHLRLTSGRLPRRCDARGCEVVQLRGSGRVPANVVVVGRGRLRSTALFGDAVPADRNELERARLAPALRRVERYHQPALPPLLLGSDVRALVRLPVLSTSYRSYGWVTPLSGNDVEPWDVRALANDVVRTRGELQLRTVGFEVAAPIEELVEARARADVGARRLLLLGGQAVALLLAFAAFAATRLRASIQGDERRLVRAGVPRWQRSVGMLAHAGLLTLLAVAGAWLVLVAGVAAAAGRSFAANALLTPDGVAALAVLALAAATVVAAATTLPSPGRGSWLDAVAVALVLATAAALARGATDAAELLRGEGTGVVLFALPIVVAALAAIAVVRLLPALARTAARTGTRNRLALRLALLSTARRPGAGAIAGAFLAVSVGLALFAATYRATLAQGQRDQAAFALGADFVLREDLRRLVPVRRVATEGRLRELGVPAAPAFRAAASVAGVAGATGVNVLGLEPELLAELRGADLDVPLLARDGTVAGVRLPDDVRVLELEAELSVPGAALEAVVLAEGDALSLRLPARVPPGARGGLLVGIRLVPPPRLQERGADAGRPVPGTATLGPLTADGRVLERAYSAWVGSGGATLRDATLTYTLTPQVVTWFHPEQPLAGAPVPAVVSPAVAALADARGRVPLEVNGRPIAFRVARVAERFPSTRGEFVVADRATLQRALDVVDPGSGFPTEAWVNAPDAASERRVGERLARAPFDALSVDSRVQREQALRDDPLSRGALAMLAVAAGAALALGLLALALATVGDVRDERRELLDLESQGASPALLRRVVRLRQLVAASAGGAVGLLAGVALVALVADVVAVSASGAEPVPPLRVAVRPLEVVVVACALAACATFVVVALTRGALRDRDAGRPEETLG